MGKINDLRREALIVSQICPPEHRQLVVSKLLHSYISHALSQASFGWTIRAKFGPELNYSFFVKLGWINRFKIYCEL